MKYSSFMSKWKFDTDCPVVDNTFRALDRKHRSLNRFLSEPLLPFSRHSYLSLSLYLYQFSMNPPMNERICKRNKTEVETRKSKLPIRSKISFWKERVPVINIEEDRLLSQRVAHLDEYSIFPSNIAILRLFVRWNLSSSDSRRTTDPIKLSYSIHQGRCWFIIWKWNFNERNFKEKLTYLIRIRSEYEIKRKVT